MGSSLSLREASKLFSVSRATLSKALENGTITGSKNEAGHWRIDPSELARVYKPRPLKPAKSPPSGPDDPAHPAQLNHIEPAQDPEIAIRLARAEAALEAEREKTAILERHLADLRSLLPAPTQANHPRSSLWPWLKSKILR